MVRITPKKGARKKALVDAVTTPGLSSPDSYGRPTREKAVMRGIARPSAIASWGPE
jgi:hypothetical protein